MFNKGKIKVESNVKNAQKAMPKIEARSTSTGKKEIWNGAEWNQSSQHAAIPHWSLDNDLNNSIMEPCYECGGSHPKMADGGNWMQNIKHTGQCTGENFGGPRCRPGTRQYAFAKRARSGEFHKQFGGDAPQNNTIDSFGQKRINTMRDFLTANMYGSMFEQEAERLKQTAPMFDDGGSIYDPNMYAQTIYADAINATKNQFKKDWRTFGSNLQNVLNSYPQPTSPVMQPIASPMARVQSRQVNVADMMDNQPNGLAIPDGGFTGVDATMAYGGHIPMAQDGLNVGTIPLTVDPYGGIGRSLGAYGIVMTPNGPMYANAITPSVAQSSAPVVRLDPTRGDATGQYQEKLAANKKAERTGNTVNAATKRTAAKSTVGATPEERKEIEAAREALKNDTAEQARGNVNKDDDMPSNQSSASSAQYYSSQPVALAPGYGGGRFKIKGVDPVTGKRFKVKYDTALSPRDVYGIRGPRVVKYDIYNNPIFEQPAMPSGRMPNMERVTPRGVSNIAGMENFNLAIPEGGYAGVPEIQAPWDYVDVSSQPGEFRSRAIPYDESAPVVRQPTLENQYTTGYVTDPEAAALEAQYQTGFKRGGAFFPQAYPGGIEAPGTQALPYFMTNGGAFNNQGSAFVGDDAYVSGPEAGSYIDESGALVTYGDQNPNPAMKAKWKGNNTGLNQWAPMLLPAANMISSIAEQGDRRRNEAHLQDLQQANNVFTTNTVRNRGKNTVNQGYFDPYNMVPVQFAGNDQGMIGSPNVYSRYGGQPQYRDGGEYELTEEEIAQIVAMGGQIEYL